MTHFSAQIRSRRRLALVPLVVAASIGMVPTIAQAGPPLICHPFQTAGTGLLPWGDGPGWNSPDPRYDTARLVDDMLRLLSPDSPVLARMENIRRAAIYAARDHRAGDALLAALLARTTTKDGAAGALAWFDAGYLIESYRQSAHLSRRRPPEQDGYAMVARAISMSEGNPSMEFAAALMTTGARADAHLRRARGRGDAGTAARAEHQELVEIADDGPDC